MPSTVERRSGRWDRLVNALPALAFVVTFGWFFVDKNRSARTVFKSGRGLLTVAVIVAGYVLIGFVLRRVVRWNWLAPVALATVVLGLAAWIVRPYYVDETANRSLVGAPVVDASDLTSSTTTDPTIDSASNTTEPATAASAPVRLSMGDLRGIGHDATGTASLVRRPDRSLVVRFEQFDIEGTPAPFVYLVDGNDVQDVGGVSLGRLEGNQGDVLDYEVPAGVDAGAGWTVLVWCRSFAVPIANSTQSAV